MEGSVKKVHFPGAYGTTLVGNLELPTAAPTTYALFAHCFTCSRNSLAEARISRGLTKYGIAVLRFDFTGLGDSGGDFADTNFSGNVDDLLKAVDFLRQNYQAPQILIGHSLGGAAVLAIAGQISEVKAVVTINAPADAADVKKLMKDKIEEIKSYGEAEVNLAGRKFHIKKQFLDDLDKQKLANSIAILRKSLLIFHSPQDEIVNINNARIIFDEAKHPKSFISLDHADHMLSDEKHALYVANVLAAWASCYLIPGVQEQSQPDQSAAAVIVREHSAEALTQEIIVGKHRFFADEPLSFGGKDLGPSPYELLLAALGACTSMTLRVYARQKKLMLEKVVVFLNHKKVYSQDCQDCENENSKIDHIDRVIELQGQLTTAEREKLLEIANKCPVHRTLTSKVNITTSLTQG